MTTQEELIVHRDTLAEVWEGIPRPQREPLLQQAGCLAGYVSAVAESRWAFLPGTIIGQLERILIQRTGALELKRVSNTLYAREEA